MKIRVELKWAFIFSVMMLLWMVLERLFGLHDKYIHLHPILTNFVAIPAIAIYVFALRDKRNRDYKGKMTYGQGLISGLIITLFVVILTPLIQYLTSTYITPHYFANVIKYCVDHKLMKAEQAEMYFNLKSYMIQATIGAAIMGAVTSAIVAIFTRKK
jgi:hypothetical protein